MKLNVYLGRFGEERLLFSLKKLNAIPQRDDFIFFNGDTYKVLYTMVDVDHNENSIFVRLAIEEDF